MRGHVLRGLICDLICQHLYKNSPLIEKALDSDSRLSCKQQLLFSELLLHNLPYLLVGDLSEPRHHNDEKRGNGKGDEFFVRHGRYTGYGRLDYRRLAVSAVW